MATTVVRDVFVDTNVLVYATAAAMPLHAAATNTLNSLAAAGNRLCISRQIVQEFVGSVTRKGVVVPHLTPAQAVVACRSIESRFRMLEEDHIVTNQFYFLIQQYQVVSRKVHDANIVATMLAHHVTHLLTHNVADFALYTNSITIIPLV